MATILGLVNRAAHARTCFYIAQQPSDFRETFPFGDIAAIVALVESQGMDVSNAGKTRILVNNTAWLTIGGMVEPI